ncbi:DNA polymerase lambda-like isoform X2 [Liolophura sinensis]|uniref:DNA polymerase lambda-like isoform X2 n=1 Tax=Liolophura sinensis TaxID=3198878 RepID=UPI0031585B56
MNSQSTKRKMDQSSASENKLKRPKELKETSGSTSKSVKVVDKHNPLAFMKDIHVYILPASIEKARMAIFKTQLGKYGATVCEELNKTCTHLVVDDKMDVDRMIRILKLEAPPTGVFIVKSSWLSTCFRGKIVAEESDHELNFTEYLSDKVKKDETSGQASVSAEKASSANIEVASSASIVRTSNVAVTNNSEGASPSKKDFMKVGVMSGAYKHAHREPTEDEEDYDSDYVHSDGEISVGKTEGYDSCSSEDDFLTDTTDNTSSSSSPNVSPNKLLPRGHWVCAQSSKTMRPNYNKHITDKLEEMVKTYQSTNDRWRALGYQKAIQAIRKHPKQISSWEEAKALPGVGSRLADKVWEIAESGELRKLNEFRSSEELQVISLFTDVWGAGAHTARTWYQQGFRTLDDLRTKANLTKQQKIGLSHYADFLDRMPRSEVEEIQKTVRDIAENLVPGTRCEVCGSYRRGKSTCGDIDILITHPDGKSHRGIFGVILSRLRQEASPD